ncbi:MAG: hypothetical protein GPJ54_03720 [Candidatus Heimdallarchaeota archaeon]|nr:hypothetical protein [Candidatus Heimdallarchaeota archaeon]
MRKRTKVHSFSIIFLLFSFSIIPGRLEIPNESRIVHTNISAQSTDSNYEFNTFSDEFTTSGTGYDQSLWHAVQKGNGNILNEEKSIILDSGDGGYQLLKSRRIFDIESSTTITMRASYEGDSEFVYFGWASSLPEESNNHVWSPHNSENAVYLKNSNFLGQWELEVIKDYSSIFTMGIEVDLTEYVSFYLSWSSVGIEVKLDGEQILYFENENDIIPTHQMYQYIGIQSWGSPHSVNYLEVSNIILQGPTTSSDMPMFLNPNNGYLFIEGDTDMTLSWIVEDDNPDNYTLWLAGTFVDGGSWESNQVITYTIDNFGVGLYQMIIQIWDRTGNSIIQAVFVKIIQSMYFTNTEYREDFDGPSLGTDWTLHQVQSSTFEFQDGNLNIEGGGVAVIENTEPQSINSSFLINIAMNEPVTHGGSGFGLSNYDYTSTSFSEGGSAFSPFIRDDASDAIFVDNSGDGSHYAILLKTNNIISEYNFYLEDPQIQDFLLLRNLNGIELYISNKLVRSFDAVSYVLPQIDLFFSAYATSWAKPGFSQINYYQIQNDTSPIIPNDVTLELPLDNTFSFILSDEIIIETINDIDDVTTITSSETFITNGTLSEELDLNLRAIIIGAVGLSLIIATIVIINRRFNPRFSGFSKEFEDGLVDELEGFETDDRINTLPFSGVCTSCGVLPNDTDMVCQSCGINFR